MAAARSGTVAAVGAHIGALVVKELVVDREDAAVGVDRGADAMGAAGANDWRRSDARAGPRSISPGGRGAAPRRRPARPPDRARRECRSRRRHGLRTDARCSAARPSMRAMLVAVPVRHLGGAVQFQHVARRVVAARWRRASPAARRNGGRSTGRARRPRERRRETRHRRRHSPCGSTAARSSGPARTRRRRVGIEHGRQLLDLDLDEVGGVLGQIGIGRRTPRRPDRRHSARGRWRARAGDRARAPRSGSGGNRSAGCRRRRRRSRPRPRPAAPARRRHRSRDAAMRDRRSARRACAAGAGTRCRRRSGPRPVDAAAGLPCGGRSGRSAASAVCAVSPRSRRISAAAARTALMMF